MCLCELLCSLVSQCTGSKRTSPSTYMPTPSKQGKSVQNAVISLYSMWLTIDTDSTGDSTFFILTAAIVGAVALTLIIISVMLSLVLAIKLCMLL